MTSYSSGPGFSASASASLSVNFAPRPVTNGLAVAALALGIVSAALALIPFAGPFLCWLPALLAIIFGIIGIGTASRIGGYRKTTAIWGLICGLIPIPIILIEVFTVLGVASSSSGH
ncbi:hypothetical protein [Frondihabitans sp. PAMC 28766]|uniref:hypothetical protein n=1 Tax=Frondihabitans sp. PAMC 28766 TaxID=1795630 RepID=UPI0012FF9084|nr:hypothetical protein [Frondihabitans sp. PAMC 28766]